MDDAWEAQPSCCVKRVNENFVWGPLPGAQYDSLDKLKIRSSVIYRLISAEFVLISDIERNFLHNPWKAQSTVGSEVK